MGRSECAFGAERDITIQKTIFVGISQFITFKAPAVVSTLRREVVVT